MLDVPKEVKTGHYDASLFGCCADIGASCKICCCYSCYESQMWADIRGEPCNVCYSSCLCPCCFHHPIWTRANIRHARGMDPSLCCQCLVMEFCMPCALCQDYREIEAIKRAIAEHKPSENSGGGASVVVVNNNNNNNNNNMMMMGAAPPAAAPAPQ